MPQPKREHDESKLKIAYIPHGVDSNLWKRLTTEEELKAAAEVRTRMFGADADKVKFVVLYNNRNIRRKMTGDVILAYQRFLEKLTPQERDACRLLFHTAPVDDNGTDLFAVLRDLAPEVKAIFSTDRVSTEDMVKIYHNCDVVINLASNEGFGIGTLEAIMSEKMIVANVTGGLQDQMGFVDEDGNSLDADVHYNAEWSTNADGTYREHGEWVVPVFPNNRALIGSPPTPYIFDDRCDWRDAADALHEVYKLGPEERARRGKLGREWAMKPSVGMTAEEMGQRLLKAFDNVFTTWTPRKSFGIYKA